MGFNLPIFPVYRYIVMMKHYVPAALAGAAVVLVLSCTSVDPAKKYPNMVANVDPISAGTIEAEFDRFFSTKLNKNTVEAIFYPRLNAVALEFRYEMIRYRQFWDEDTRKQFADALERYKTDYAARNLTTKYRKSRSIYGRIKGRVEWETFKLTKTRVGYPVIELGYRFKENSPFFATLMRSAKEENPPPGESSSESPQVTMYFTRAQADELVKLFDQAYLMGLLGGTDNSQSEQPLIVDEYREF